MPAQASAFAAARSISLDANALSYLESLAARAFLQIYGVRTGFWDGLGGFFRGGFTGAVRTAKWHILASFLLTLLGVVTSFFLTLGNEDWFYTFVSDDMAQGRTPASTRTQLLDVLTDSGEGIGEAMYVFATFLFTHNAAIGLLCFALGFAFGLPVVLLLFYNGLTLGAFAAIHHAHGLSLEFWAWIAIHGSTELLAVIICGGAGLLLATALAFPGEYSRLANLARQGRVAACIVMGAV
ncbi:MAG: stage II sporulation protein M, partial [Alphaproteobacteria bacterium]